MQVSFTNSTARNILKRTFTAFDSSSMYQNNSSSIANRANENTFAYSADSGSPSTTYATLALCQGSVPSNFSGLTTTSSRSSDVLVTWALSTAVTYGTWTEISDQPSIYLTATQRSSASQSGVATWLWWYNTLANATTTIIHQAVFTVGTLGSGSEFELIDINIVSGRGYKIVNGPRLTMATEYNY